MAAPDAEKIRKALRAVTRAEDNREDLQLELASKINCQSMLNTAPMTVAVIGHLTLVTLHKDVPLHGHAVKYEFIKYPESLRACTVQLANDAWSAFYLAEKNMDQIRIYTSQVPGHVKSAVKLILGGTEREIVHLLPSYLEVLHKISTECVQNADAVNKAFLSVYNLTQELQEACVVTQGNYETKIKDAVTTSDKRKRQLELSDQVQREMKSSQEKMKTEIQEAKEKYDEQIKSLPGAGALIGMAVADSLCKVIAAPGYLIKGVASLFTGKEGSTSHQELGNYISFVSEATKKLQENLDRDHSEDEEVKDMRSSLESHLSSLLSESGPLKDKLEDIYNKAIDVTSEMMDAQQTDKEKVKQEMSRLQGMVEAAELFNQTLTGGMPITGSCPKMSKVESAGPLDAYVRQAYFKVECAENALKTAKSDFAELNERLDRERHKNLSLLNDLSEVRLDKINFEEIIELLKRCMGALADIRQQWGMLVHFFQMLSNVIECELQCSLDFFRKSIAIEKDPSLAYSFSDVMLDIIYTQTAQANGVAMVACNVSEMYTEISQRYLINPLASLGKLLALDPKTDAEEIRKKQLELTVHCNQATAAVGEYLQKRKEEFDVRISMRLQRIQKEMMSVLPPRPRDDPETTKLKQQAFEEAKALRNQELDEAMEQYT